MPNSIFSKFAQIGIFPLGNIHSTQTPAMECTTFIFDKAHLLPELNQKNLIKKTSHAFNNLYYGGVDTPTTRRLASKLAEIEKGYSSIVTPSGQSAINLLLTTFVKSGDHVLVFDTVIYSTKWLLDHYQRRGVAVEYLTPKDINILDLKLKRETKLVFLENPGAITFELLDISKIVKKCSRHQALVAVDNTWAASTFQHPLASGADISLISMSKTHAAIEGVSLGALITRRNDLYARIKSTSALIGNHVSSHTCAAALRALSTLGARLCFQMKTTLQIITHLKTAPLCRTIAHPTLQYSSNKLQQLNINGFNSLVTFELSCSRQDLIRRINRLKLIKNGYGWGGPISLINTIDTNNLPSAKRLGLGTSCARLYVGLEDPRDLLNDLDQMLAI